MIINRLLKIGYAIFIGFFLALNVDFAKGVPLQTDVNQATHIVDAHGVPHLKIADVGVVDHPAWTALYALAYAGIEDYDPTLGIEPDPAHFESSIAWLKTNLKQNKDGLWVWAYQFDNTYNDVVINAPWSSAFAQAVGIQALLAHWRATRDETSLELAEKAAQSLFVPLQQGGFLFQRDEDAFFEEIPSPIDNPSHILNGHMRVLLAVNELKDATENTEYAQWLSKGTDTLLRWLPLYDAGYWLRYDLNPRKDELLFRLANPYGFANPELAVDRIVLRDPVSGKESVLDVGASDDAEGALRIAGNDWGQTEQLDGRSVRRLLPTPGQREANDSEGEMVPPHSYFYLELPAKWQDNLRRERLELMVEYLDETPGNLQVQMRSIAPGATTFRELKDGDLLLSGSKQWRQWKVPVNNQDIGFWVGKLYAQKHVEYLHKLAGIDKRISPWAQTAGTYLNSLDSEDIFQIVTPEKFEAPQQTPMLPFHSLDNSGVLMPHFGIPGKKYDLHDTEGLSDTGIPVYSPFTIAAYQLLDNSLQSAFTYLDVKASDIKKEAALEWFKSPKNKINLGDSITWQYNFENTYNDVVTPAPWASAFSQAYVIKALNSYAKEFGHDSQVQDLITRAALAYMIPTSQGGISSFGKSRHIYFEEVPNNTHVLNAHLISVLELADIAKQHDDPRIQHTLAAGSDTLREKLSQFDTGYWMRYDANPKKEMLFQLDWLSGEISPLIENISLDSPQSARKIILNTGEEQAFNGASYITGTDWLTAQEVDGKRVRGFSNGYLLHPQAVQGGTRHNVYALMQLPERTFSDYFDIYPHRLTIRYKDISAGQFVIKIQSINEGNVLNFVPLRNAVITTTGDQQWKKAVIEVRPQDMGWYKGPDYQTYEVEQLQRIAELSDDWFFEQYAERQGYFLQAKNNGQSVIVQSPVDAAEIANETGSEKQTIHLSVLASSPVHDGFGFENALDGDPNNDYVAGLENIDPAYVDLQLDKRIARGDLRLIWENQENYAQNIRIFALDENGNAAGKIEEISIKDGKNFSVALKYHEGFQSIRLEFSGFSGQPRILLRLIELVSLPPFAASAGNLDSGLETNEDFMDAKDPGNPLNIFKLPITRNIYDISNQLTKNTQDEHQKVLAFMQYIDEFSLGFPSTPTPDVIAKEKIGLCGNFTVLLLALARSQGMEGRIVNLYNYPKNMGHTVAEIKFGDKWHLYDPTYNAFYSLKSDTTPLSFVEIKSAYQNGVSVVENIRSARNGVEGFTGKEIFLNANPSGVIGPDKPFFFPLTLDALGVDSIDASDFGTAWQGADFIGVAWSNQQQDWTFVNLQKDKHYTFEITQKGVGGDFERSDAGEFSLRAIIHHKDGSATELAHVFPPPPRNADVLRNVWRIPFLAQADTQTISLRHDYSTSKHRYITLQRYKLYEGI